MQFISVWNTSLVGFCHLYYLYIQLIYILLNDFAIELYTVRDSVR